MKLQEYLSQLDKKQIEEIGNNLAVIDKSDMRQTFSIPHMIKLIVNNRLLDENYLHGLLNNEDKMKFDDEMLRSIKKIIFGIDVKNQKNIDQFKKCGLVFNGNKIPEDLRGILVNKYRKEMTSNLEKPVLYNKHTLFLKLIFFINKIYYNETLDMSFIKKNNSKHMKLITDYLSNNSIISIDKKHVKLNLDNYVKWIKGKEQVIRDFYYYIFKNTNEFRVKELFYNLILIQVNAEQWIEVNKIKWLIEEYKDEFSFAVDIGLIIKAKDNHDYIQLNNEVFIIFNKDIPKAHIVVTADFKVFVEYKDDPLFILMLSNFGELKNEIYNNDYLLSFDISEGTIKKSKIREYEKFLEYLKTKCNYIPDLVNEQFMELCK